MGKMMTLPKLKLKREKLNEAPNVDTGDQDAQTNSDNGNQPSPPKPKKKEYGSQDKYLDKSKIPEKGKRDTVFINPIRKDLMEVFRRLKESYDPLEYAEDELQTLKRKKARQEAGKIQSGYIDHDIDSKIKELEDGIAQMKKRRK